MAAAEAVLERLEVGIPKARMEAASQRAKADDLAARLGSLRAATKVPPACPLPTHICCNTCSCARASMCPLKNILSFSSICAHASEQRCKNAC